MPKKPLPKTVVDVWPEILKDVDIQVIPIEYLDSVRLYFTDGKIWDIDIKKTMKDKPTHRLEEIIEDLIAEYNDVIENVDFRLDTVKVKEDIQKRTRLFMKKRK